MWTTLDWRKTWQVVVILFAAGLTMTLIFAGLGILVHLIGTSAVWSTVVAIITGGGAYGYVRRRQRRAESEHARP